MASTEQVAKRMHLAHVRAAEVISEHGSEERADGLQWLSPNGAPPPLRFGPEFAAYQAEMLAAVCEILEGQAKDIADLRKQLEDAKGSSKSAKK